MNSQQEKKLKLLAKELALDLKTGEDLSALSAKLVKLTVEAALSAEMENHPGYARHVLSGHHSGNSRIANSWKNHWLNLRTIFDFPEEVRKAIYPTNAIKSLNSVIRKATKKRKIFPTDESALKVIFPATQAAAAKWTMPIQNWKQAMNRFAIKFEEQLNPYS